MFIRLIFPMTENNPPMTSCLTSSVAYSHSFTIRILAFSPEIFINGNSRKRLTVPVMINSKYGMDVPARSANVYCIEHVWDLLGRRIEPHVNTHCKINSSERECYQNSITTSSKYVERMQFM